MRKKGIELTGDDEKFAKLKETFEQLGKRNSGKPKRDFVKDMLTVKGLPTTEANINVLLSAYDNGWQCATKMLKNKTEKKPERIEGAKTNIRF